MYKSHGIVSPPTQTPTARDLPVKDMLGTSAHRSPRDIILMKAASKRSMFEKPSAIEPNVPKQLERICLKALEQDRRRRYGSAVEMELDLRRLNDAPEEDTEESDSRGTVRIVAVVLIGIVLLCLGFGIVWGLGAFPEPIIHRNRPTRVHQRFHPRRLRP